MKIELPEQQEYIPYFQHYISLVEGNPIEVLRSNCKINADWILNYPASKLDTAYAPGKWTVKDVFQHIIDTERILTFRALCIARGDHQVLPSFDENEYAKVVDTSLKSIDVLVQEYKAVRENTILFFSSLTKQELVKIGKTDSSVFSPRAIAYINAGHDIHHFNVLRERY